MNLPQPDSGPDSNINSPYYTVLYIFIFYTLYLSTEAMSSPISSVYLFNWLSISMTGVLSAFKPKVIFLDKETNK
jgi:hypothetical protein